MFNITKLLQNELLKALLSERGRGEGNGGLIITSFAFHESRNKYLRFHACSKIKVVQNVKNVTLVPFCKAECFDYILAR